MFFEFFADPEVVEAPADIPIAAAGLCVPPGVAVGDVPVDRAEGVGVAGGF